MKKQHIQKIITILTAIFLAGIIQVTAKETIQSTDVINITAEEAWELLSDTENGIQIPIDVRTYDEWYASRIDTPYPEYPRHVPVNDLQDTDIRQDFMMQYSGSDLIIYCKSGGRSSSAASLLSNSGFNGTVYNMLGGITSWKGGGFPSKSGNSAPLPPDTPSGASVVTLNQTSSYSTMATDPNDDLIRYGWDWDADDIIDEWTDYQPAGEINTMTHIFQMPGTKQIQVKTEDLVGEQSTFSEVFSVLVNQAPTTPTISGPTNGKAGETYEYIVQSSDPEDHHLSYEINWGDETIDTMGPYSSEESITFNHTWEEQNTYLIQVKAIDEHGAESEIIQLEVSMPKTHLLTNIYSHLMDYLRILLNHIR